jgi:hypothetical protein
MSEQALQDAYATLKLTMDSNQAMIEAAHRQHRELFNNTSIACYSLCSEAEQEESLKAVETAYQLIISERFPEPAQSETAPPEEVKAEEVKAEPPRVNQCSIEVATPAPGASLGEFLQQQRQKLGIPLTAIVDQTKISKTLLRHIEQETYAELPAPVYLRGFIIAFAKIVQVADPHLIASQYLEQMRPGE